MSIPTLGEEFAKLIEHLRYAQEDAAMLAHLHRDDSRTLARAWLAVSENLKKLQGLVTHIAQGHLQ
jgi:hypothetical protein